jgi:hypothetical protein
MGHKAGGQGSHKFLVKHSSSDYFRRFQTAETYEELIDMLRQNVFSICAYLIKVKKIHEKQIPQRAEESYI